jgi:hypothetical protein
VTVVVPEDQRAHFQELLAKLAAGN